jgi:ketosteroid isomerase-like protein
MDRQSAQDWLDRYVAAWESYDRDDVAALFSEDVEYRYHPYDEPVRGRDSVVAAWREEAEFPGASGRDEPGIYDGSYRAVAIDGDVAVAVGQSTYTDGPDGPVAEVYDNCFLLRFNDEGRCREFTEWFVKRPLGADA